MTGHVFIQTTNRQFLIWTGRPGREVFLDGRIQRRREDLGDGVGLGPGTNVSSDARPDVSFRRERDRALKNTRAAGALAEVPTASTGINREEDA